MDNKSTITVLTAFEDCAEGCPEFDIERCSLFSGGRIQLVLLKCANIDHCKHIAEHITEVNENGEK